MKNALGIGPQSPSDNQLQKRLRLHQSWWRTFVLGEESGPHPMRSGETVGSSISGGEQSFSNFLDEYAIRAVKETLEQRNNKSKGMINEKRLFNNLLSSQPLCFNFFGRLKYNLNMATKVLQYFYPAIKNVTAIHFEFAPNAARNNDNSAHDVAIEFISGDGKNGLIGLESKYSEPFSPKVYRNDKYKRLFDESAAFSADYDKVTGTKYNQLFRNQLILESALQNGAYDVVYSGLFCYEKDDNATTKGLAFQNMLKDGENRFKIITFTDFISTIQKQEIDEETREWSILLWARYCGIRLSEEYTK
ncbi:PGN_0703 family putative restriction endonuclease [Draconibacterium sediminis]|uniref:PGN_0703 family putative restriction endonuclease n=1 Tax=Draconibacterium sediminis TaxID=1544798 RepID=UPI0006974989|nr:hypothetical protein [Draconibacterium sediminis]